MPRKHHNLKALFFEKFNITTCLSLWNLSKRQVSHCYPMDILNIYKYIVMMAVAMLVILTGWVGSRFFSKKTLIKELDTTFESPEIQRADAKEGVIKTFLARHELKRSFFSRFTLSKIAIHKSTNPYIIAIAFAVIIPSISLFFNEMHEIEQLIPKEYGYGDRIMLTLQEEKLVPPPPVPPEAFVDAIAEQPSLSRADRDWSRLDPGFVQVILRVMVRMEARGYPMTLLEGYRSPERQDALAGQANLVTKAKGGQSKHQYGLAVDLAPLKNGKVVITERDPWAMAAYLALGEESKAAGLTWGGDWSFKDYGHVERSGSIKKLIAQPR